MVVVGSNLLGGHIPDLGRLTRLFVGVPAGRLRQDQGAHASPWAAGRPTIRSWPHAADTTGASATLKRGSRLGALTLTQRNAHCCDDLKALSRE